jgi:vacuolar-type H+-ATPase subunit F/Vma7
MTRIAAIGEHERVVGFAFAGVHIATADRPDEALAAWKALPEDVGLVILTRAAHAAVASELSELETRLCVVMPA